MVSEQRRHPDLWSTLASLRASAEEDEKKKQKKSDEEKNAEGEAGEQAPSEGHEGDAEKREGDNEEADKESKMLRPKIGAETSTRLLVVGSKGAGKSSLVNLLIGKTDDKPKATVALEYTFGKKSVGDGSKILCQMWELGGGDKLADLIPIVVNGEGLSVVVTVDLGQPSKAIQEADKWTTLIREKLGKRVPVILVANKYDLLENQDGVQRKLVSQALRYIAHERRAGLIYLSRKDKTTINYVKAIIGQYVFHSEKKRSCYVDSNKPIIVAPGRDKLEKIGLPSGMTPDAPPRNIIAAYLRGLSPESEKDTSPESKDEPQDEVDCENGEQYLQSLAVEPVVDARRKQKDADLEQYRAQVARKQRLEKSN